jgi:hypothetical protein
MRIVSPIFRVVGILLVVSASMMIILMMVLPDDAAQIFREIGEYVTPVVTEPGQWYLPLLCVFSAGAILVIISLREELRG